MKADETAHSKSAPPVRKADDSNWRMRLAEELAKPAAARAVVPRSRR
ncbi:MAG: hypothetical protein R3D78_02080 [Paracoccaceae bacterium]